MKDPVAIKGNAAIKNSVAIPLLATLLLHGLLVLALIYHFDFAAPVHEVKTPPPIIQARLVSMHEHVVARSHPDMKLGVSGSKRSNPPPAPKPPEPDRKTALKRQQQDAKKQAALKAEAEKKAREQKAKEQAEKARKEKERKEKERKEKERKEQERKEQERKEQERKDLLLKQREQAAREELAKSLARDEEARAQAREGQLVQSYQGMIQQSVQRHWSRPPSARNGMHCVLMIQLIPTGEVVDVQVVTSSGDDAFDRSAVNAVRKAAPFSDLANLYRSDAGAFDKNFRRFQLDFIPEDLRQ